MRVLRAQVSGMCFGVRDALAALEAVQSPDQATIRGELVHNPEVTRRLAALGFHQQSETDRATLPETPTVVVTAHGISDRTRRLLGGANKNLIDTTCPLVRFVHEAARRFSHEGRFVIVLGRKGHVEVLGIIEDLEESAVVETADDIRCFERVAIGIVCQSTLPPSAVQPLLDRIRELNPGASIELAETICLPTRQRQDSVLALLAHIDALIVVGGKNSNNTRQLAELARSRGLPAHQVETADSLRPDDLWNYEVVGLTAGTSTLEETIDEVHRKLLSLGDDITLRNHAVRAR